MNRGAMQKSPVQQMMGGSPNWWNINNMRPPISHQQIAATSVPSLLAPNNNHFSPTVPLPSPPWNNNQEQLPESWSQLLLGGLVGEEEKSVHLSNMQAVKSKLENNWEEQSTFLSQAADSVIDVNQKNFMYEHVNNVDFHHQTEITGKPTWSQMMPLSSPKSCVTTLSSNMLDFSNNKSDTRHPPPDHSSECNSRATSGAPNKKARVQPSSTQSTFKVRKEKLGDRITALHQLVSPFGKTDTASVLLEAIGYIRFLQSQIEALSLPYLGSGSGNMRQQHQQSVQERNSLFPEDPGQLSNDNCLKRMATSEQYYHEESKKDLRSRGLCLVPLSCTLQVGSDNGADYWAPAFGGGFR
uniref:Transcription factor bHLH68 n=1 Tax=Nicotiana tabacum TaxID=4097 RepID=A0A1S4C2P2_TOBAC|nr:PREDICTED: transcription factor bHLH68-like [Nicotiana tabacum]